MHTLATQRTLVGLTLAVLSGCSPRSLLSDASTDARTDASVDSERPPASLRCPTVFRYVPPAGRAVSRVEVSGEFNSWTQPGIPLTADGMGGFAATVPIPVGFHGYKLIVDGTWELDLGGARRKYVDGTENSGVLVADCRSPTFAVVRSTPTRPAPPTSPTVGTGRYEAEVRFVPGVERAALDPASVRVSLRRDGMSRNVDGVTVDATSNTLRIAVGALADGKYTALVEARDATGRAAEPMRLPFWVEAEPFSWQGATIYMAMIDRFANGDRSNDARPTSGVDPRVDYQGGDFQGLQARIADGTLDRLGVRAIWLAPVNRNAEGAFLASDGQHRVMGYHGYWPTRAREVDPRLGGAEALRAMIAEAHRHGIRVLQDFVVNHVHRDHEYFRTHPEWFRTGCVCGTNNCDWTANRLECLFTDYLPDVNWTVPELSLRLADDAAFWVDEFDFDGLRVDAVKHVEDIAVLNLRATLHERFENTGLRVFLTGETAMGWSDCGVGCNREQYDTISRYMGPLALDGQADFVLYHAVPYRAFSSDQMGMIHVDYWTQQSQQQYPAGGIMTPYIGSHDTARFATLAAYRGQGPGLDPSIPGNQWDNIATVQTDPNVYQRHRLAMSWVLTIPGAPLVYYGDEYAAWGGGDPNNRTLWRDESMLSTAERAMLTHVRALGSARRELVAMREGEYVSLGATEETLVFGRRTRTQGAVVALSKANTPRMVTVSVSALGLSEGSTLRDRLGGPSVVVRGGSVSVSIPSWGAVILAP
ncbi:MAG: alpha-amylase family glycosyl hydrolase [Deltaproteobacteria bacterium]|nr:alpha-amylase family glycosyl hydrolase [Deltaproteobacteria bacterium]